MTFPGAWGSLPLSGATGFSVTTVLQGDSVAVAGGGSLSLTRVTCCVHRMDKQVLATFTSMSFKSWAHNVLPQFTINFVMPH